MFSRVQSVHFGGICGTAMASVAAAMQQKGVKDTGSDQHVYPPMSTFLAERNIEVISGYAEQKLAHKPDLSVIGNAISRGNPEADYLLEVAIINNLEFDHADIFESLDAIKKSFAHFIRLIPRNGLLLANGDDSNLAPLLNVTHCPVKRFGLGEPNAVQAFNIRYGPTASEFEIPSFKFHLNLVGELNVRNALAVVACAKHCGLSNKQIQSAFDTFRGIKRRMEVRGIAGGVTVVDDFGHHPTAIRETLRALRIKYPRQKIWAVFEPRSNTTRRNVFQAELVSAFADADAVVVAQIARLELLPAQERLDPARLMQDLQACGKPAAYLPDADAIVGHVAKNLQGGDVICVFSNGGFGGIHGKLLERLGRA